MKDGVILRVSEPARMGIDDAPLYPLRTHHGLLDSSRCCVSSAVALRSVSVTKTLLGTGHCARGDGS